MGAQKIAALAACEGCPSENGRALARLRKNGACFGRSIGRIRDFSKIIQLTHCGPGKFSGFSAGSASGCLGFSAFLPLQAIDQKMGLRRFDFNLQVENTSLARFLRGRVFVLAVFLKLQGLIFSAFRFCKVARDSSILIDWRSTGNFGLCVIGNKHAKQRVFNSASVITKSGVKAWKI